MKHKINTITIPRPDGPKEVQMDLEVKRQTTSWTTGHMLLGREPDGDSRPILAQNWDEHQLHLFAGAARCYQAVKLVLAMDSQPESANVPGFIVKLDPKAREQLEKAVAIVEQGTMTDL